MSDGFTRSVTLPPRRRQTPALNAAVNAAPTPAATPRVRPKAIAVEPEDPRLAAISPAARALAIAHLVDGWLRDGTVANMTAAARLLKMTPCRVQQIDQLLSLSPVVQERVLLGEISPSVRDLTWLVRSDLWDDHDRWLQSLLKRAQPRCL